jgi:hypothetical protein
MKPILFSTDMVKAILEGRKAQTRRVVKPQPKYDYYKFDHLDVIGLAVFTDGTVVKCPYGKVGDKLWVRETWYQYADGRVLYRASDNSQNYFSWRPSIFMPRWASRITLEITGIRVERLQEITYEGCEREGFRLDVMGNWDRARLWYKDLWDKLNPKHNWDSNPFVWVIEFKVAAGL